MLNDDALVALNDILAACATSADLHEWAAEHAENDALRQHAGTTAQHRHQAIERLADEARAHDALPHLPDPESAGFQAVLTGIKAFVAGAVAQPQREAIVDALKDAERAIAEHIATAQALDLPPSTRTALSGLASEVEEVLQRLDCA